jgi:hypothetical protein
VTAKRKRKDPAAVKLGRRGGAAKTEAQAAAGRVNGAKGGRPLKLQAIAVKGRSITVHPRTTLVGVTMFGQPLLRAETKAAAQWLRRNGYLYGAWKTAEVLEPFEKAWG